MFGGFAPPTYSKEELDQLSAEANTTVRNFVVTAAVLYFSPFVVDAVSSLF